MKTIQTYLKTEFKDTRGLAIEKKCREQLNINTGEIKTSKFYSVDYEITEADFKNYAENCLPDTCRSNCSEALLLQHPFGPRLLGLPKFKSCAPLKKEQNSSHKLMRLPSSCSGEHLSSGL